jgi:hypothetical protein
MAAITPQTITRAGLEATYEAAAAEDTFVDDGTKRTFFHVKNGSGADVEVTFTSHAAPAANSGQAAEDLVVDVTAGEERMIGPFGPNFISGGVVSVAYESTTTVTVAVLVLTTA